MVNVSVIIPTFRRPKSLALTLESLREQTFQDFELLVVDNADTADTRRVTENFAATAPFEVRYLPYAKDGNAGARNHGVTLSRSDLLVFTDDDVSPEPGWLERYRERFRDNPDMAAAGGRVVPEWQAPAPEWLLKYVSEKTREAPWPCFGPYALMDQSPEFVKGPQVWFFSCNMAARREIFSWTGFHPEIEDGKTIGDGESGLKEDLTRAGLIIGYEPEATVRHRIGPERMTARYLCRWAWHLGGCVMYQRWRGRRRTLSAALQEALFLAREFAPAWAKAPLLTNDNSRRAIDTRARASEGWCRLAYLLWLFCDPTVRQALDKKDFSVCPQDRPR